MARWFKPWASQKSYRHKDDDSEPPAGRSRNSEAHFHGEMQQCHTQSKTDGDAQLPRKSPGKEARLSYMGHAVMENRNDMIVKAAASLATGKAERDVAADLLAALPGTKKRTVGTDKNYDAAGFVEDRRATKITPMLPGITIGLVAPRLMVAPVGTRVTRSASGVGNG